MTNRSTNGAERKLRTVSLTFPKPQVQHKQGNGIVSNNGFRPHGGYRGLQGNPPSPYSFNKSERYHSEIQADVQQWLESENAKYAPRYAISTSKMSTHSGESPLFLNGLLSPCKSRDRVRRAESARQARQGKTLYYRPEGKHQYLPATSPSSSLLSLDSLKYGRPTRTTLLRARQRCNSAPLSTSSSRQQLKKEIEESIARRSAASLTVKDLLQPGTRNGESVYSFLVGARYNRAHCLDARSAEDFGVYMPRNNPLGCFMVKDRYGCQGSDGVPSTPPAFHSARDTCDDVLTGDDDPNDVICDVTSPSSPAHDDVALSEREPPDVIRDAASLPFPPVGDDSRDVIPGVASSREDATSSRTENEDDVAEINSPLSQSDIEEDSGSPVDSHKHADTPQAWGSSGTDKQPPSRPRSAAPRRHLPLMQQIINLDDGLNITGRGMQDKAVRGSVRPKSARPLSARKPTVRPTSARPAGTPGPDTPFVVIQGKSMTGRRRSRDAIDRTLSANDPGEVIIPTGATQPAADASSHSVDPPPTPVSLSARNVLAESPSLPTCSEQTAHVAEGVHVTEDTLSEAHAPVHETIVEQPIAMTTDNGESENDVASQGSARAAASDVMSDVDEKRVRFADELHMEKAMSDMSLTQDGQTHEMSLAQHEMSPAQDGEGDACQVHSGDDRKSEAVLPAETGESASTGNDLVVNANAMRSDVMSGDVTFFMTEEDKVEQEKNDIEETQ